uniref:Arf-GAP domain-containing protein n=1 Tax=Grammatophora oceanica TaxID=210454 RepID=A0A7S1UYF9_9STRA|eukprot:CAMPEP_0194052318 /NCGR_PEP_ID=MMETSP0009_2-20130614/44946_1 /TAXON_ID=210454 /ORGANISM="Grammatophora oceanica, Strain CCMP 410" /LENGTH=192 /DNA_ID=CAMNT_0038699851 /DNA_START=6 /DNA_END=584 /DNA_ORIENTATION=+
MTNVPAKIEQCNLLLEQAAHELASMRSDVLQPFPSACRRLVRNMPGNQQCIDCGSAHPEWATVSYGALICMRCSGRHRSLGVKFSKVRSVTMDHWNKEQVLSMLEGGNEQLRVFFQRHELAIEGKAAAENLRKRYWTKAAKFYQRGMQAHVSGLADKQNVWRGRQASRSPKAATHASPVLRSNMAVNQIAAV